MHFAPINVALLGANTIVAAVTAPTAKKIRVNSYMLVAAGTVNVTWQSSVTPTLLSGAMSMIAGVPFSLREAGTRAGEFAGYLETLPGEGLQLVLSGNVQVSGHLAYELLP